MTEPFPRTITVQQNIINLYTPNITAVTIRETDFTPRHLEWLFNTDRPKNFLHCVGISGAYTQVNRSLAVLALAVNSVPGDKPEFAHVLLIELSSKATEQVQKVRDGLMRVILCRDRLHLYGFDLAPLSLLLHMHHGILLNSGIDIQSAFPTDSRIPLASIRFALGDDTETNADNISALFRQNEYNPGRPQDLVQRTWLSAYMANLEVMQGSRNPDAPKIDTNKLSQPVCTSVLIYILVQCLCIFNYIL